MKQPPPPKKHRNNYLNFINLPFGIPRVDAVHSSSDLSYQSWHSSYTHTSAECCSQELDFPNPHYRREIRRAPLTVIWTRNSTDTIEPLDPQKDKRTM